LSDNLNPKIEGKVSHWIAYWPVYRKMKAFRHTTASEALGNIGELEELLVDLKKSSPPEALQNKGMQARINILHNEVLRLKDMSDNIALKASDINKQISKIMGAYGAFNSKINAIYFQEILDAEVSVEDSLLNSNI